MPQIFKLGSYIVYFWSNEGRPTEPVHVHVCKGNPTSNGTKIWITKAGKCLLSNNNAGINSRTLRNIMRIIEAQSDDIIQMWMKYFGSVSYYC